MEILVVLVLLELLAHLYVPCIQPPTNKNFPVTLNNDRFVPQGEPGSELGPPGTPGAPGDQVCHSVKATPMMFEVNKLPSNQTCDVKVVNISCSELDLHESSSLAKPGQNRLLSFQPSSVPFLYSLHAGLSANFHSTLCNSGPTSNRLALVTGGDL